MIKQATFFKRRPDLSAAAFHDYWRNRHPEFVCRIPGLKRYVQNHVIGDDGPFDGIAEVWFEDMDAMRANAAAPELEAVRADEANFLDTAGMASIIADEYVIKDGKSDEDAEKLMALVFRQTQHSPERFFELYRDELARVGAGRRGHPALRPGPLPDGHLSQRPHAGVATPSRRSGSRTRRDHVRLRGNGPRWGVRRDDHRLRAYSGRFRGRGRDSSVTGLAGPGRAER